VKVGLVDTDPAMAAGKRRFLGVVGGVKGAEGRRTVGEGDQG
jgi:hypothetical protein